LSKIDRLQVRRKLQQVISMLTNTIIIIDSSTNHVK